jgi:hypothetical protein
VWVAGRGLGRALDHVISDRRALADDRQLPPIKVNVLPPQAGNFTSAQAAQGDQPPQRVERIVGDEAQELGRPDRHRRPTAVLTPLADPGIGPDDRVRTPRHGHLHTASRIVGDHALADRGIVGGAERGPGCAAESPPCAAAPWA